MHVTQNIIANLLGRGLSAVISIVVVPVYIHFIGVEAYGMVGFFAGLTGLLTLFDLGLGAAVNRELARGSCGSSAADSSRDLVRTLEWIYWGMAILAGGLVIGLAPWLSTNWIRAETLSRVEIADAIVAMGIAVAAQFPYTLYAGGLMGLQRQVLLNSILAVTTIVRALGAIAILAFVSPTIQAFFFWQIVVSTVQSIVTGMLLWSSLPPSPKPPAFNMQALGNVRRFALGMLGISASVVLVKQADKIVLSKELSLEMFGYYSLATVVTMGLTVISQPIFAAVFPRLSQFVAHDGQAEIRRLYHRSAQVLAVLVIPIAVTLAAFSEVVMLAWTNNEIIAQNTSGLVTVLAVGTTINCIMNIPYAAQLAYGWTSLSLVQNLISAAILLPALVLSARQYGAIGAAAVWLALNLGYVTVGVFAMHRRILRAEAVRWYLVDNGIPLAVTAIVVSAGAWIMPAQAGVYVQVLWIVCICFMATMASAFAAAEVRSWLQNVFRQLRARASSSCPNGS